jgi:hypothetical protein
LAGIGIEAVDEKSERAEAMGGWKVIGLLITVEIIVVKY